MKDKLRAIWSVFRREVGFSLRDKDILVIVLLSPLFYAFFYGSVYMNKTEANVPVVVVDADHTAISRQIARDLNAHQLVQVVEIVPDLPTARDRLFRLKAQGIIYIPAHFEANLKSGKGADLIGYINTSKFLVANDINKAVSETVLTIAAGIRVRYFQAQGAGFAQAREMAVPLRGDIRHLFNTSQAYGDFLIPGILVLILQQTLLIGLSESMALERENKWLGNYYRTARGSIWAMISGKSLFYFTLFSAYALFFYTVHFALFKLNFLGSVSALMVMTVIFLASVIYLSLFISSFFSRKIISLQFFVFTSYPIFLLSGYSWPLPAMPRSLQMLTQLIPSTPYLQAFVRITQMGAGWAHVWPQMVQLLLLAIAGLVGVRLRLKKLLNSELGESLDSPLFRLKRKIKSSGGSD